MKKSIPILLLLAVVITCVRCNNEPKKEEETSTGAKPKSNFIIPKDFPDPGIPGFRFPEDSNVINGWIDSMNNDKIAAHAWGVWAGLNTNSGEQAEGQDIRIFETWLTPDDMMQMIVYQENNGRALSMEEVKTHRGTLHRPHQFLHKEKQAARMLGITNIDSLDSTRITGFVKYDPTAAQFAVKNKLFDSAVLQGMLNAGNTEIPQFPNTGITIKPVFEIFQVDADTFKQWGGCYRLNVWPGTPSVPKAYGEGSWPGWVYVDPKNNGQGNGGVDTGQGKNPQNTYNVDNFIHFKLDQQTANELNASGQTRNAKAGDIAILVAMHVTTKETFRWTWQTYWWTPDADNPPAPSSKAVAAQRPKELTGAPRHYALAPAYTYIYPNQPYTGGNNKGTSIYAFNPYLEASFTFGPIGKAALNDPAFVITNGKPVENNWGVRTNCMSCHAHANYAPSTVAQKNQPQYIGDTYIDLNAPIYKQTLKLDFAWSIQGNLITAENRNQFKR